jgi:hypothetical protein
MKQRDKIAKVVTKLDLHAPPGDLAYWRSRSIEERLSALESIRQEFHKWKYGAEPRLQRVYTIVKLK